MLQRDDASIPRRRENTHAHRNNNTPNNHSPYFSCFFAAFSSYSLLFLRKAMRASENFFDVEIIKKAALQELEKKLAGQEEHWKDRHWSPEN
jgi:hypothetical protein